MDKSKLNSVIEKLNDKIKNLHSDIVDLKNENDDLKLKGGALSPVIFDKLNSQLNLKETELLQKESKIKQLESDLERTVASLRDFHSRMVKLD